ncbi:MAG: type II toxin-antitoxin system RelE/ParE family toxin [Gemmatimonadaceae bacterium]|nr:type II toxin-antitoxin system RelE/ParE family toxin [Gemmatimonadaceae bacterium]
MLPLRWTEHAVTQLEGVVDYISATSPVYAEGVVLRIDQRLQLARVHPEIGKRVPEKDDPTIRELVAPPYRVFYRPRPDCIEVLAIVHGRQSLADAF